MARFELSTHAGAGALHRHQGLDHARRRLADGQYGEGRDLFGADHPAYAEVTTIGGWKAGDEVNIEVDLMARYAARLTEMRRL